MSKLKVITIVGTRPELIRLACTIKKLDKFCDHILVHTGQNYDYELNEVFFRNLSIRKPDYFLEMAGSSAMESIGSMLISIDKVLKKEKPRAALILGDTNSALSAIALKRNQIPIFHMEAGNRCFDMRVPEEINRKIVDHISDINLTYSDIARECLIKEGFPSNLIIKSGSPLFEVINYFNKSINKSDILKKLKIKKNNYIVLSFHREENIENRTNFFKIIEIIDKVSSHFSCPIIFSTHPRTMKKLLSEKIEFNKNVNIIKPLGFFDYIFLQKNSKIVLSDSGSISEESSILNIKALNIRECHERHESFEEAPVIMTGLCVNRIIDSINILLTKDNQKPLILPVSDYMTPNVSEKVLRIILSYTGYIEREVWKK